MENFISYKPIHPEGISDLLEEKSFQESSLVENLMKNFKLNGYEEVNPPLLEYEKNFRYSTEKSLNEDALLVIDPITNKTMLIRNDITPQIARIASSRTIEKGLPLRLSYTGYVLKSKGNQLHPDRQIRQAGIELFNKHSNETAIEVISVGLESLKKVNISNIIIDITIPSLTNIILNNFSLDEETKKITDSYLKVKNLSKIKTIPKCGKLLAKIADAAGDFERAIRILNKIDLPSEGKKFIRDVKIICKGIKNIHKDVTITIDPIENRGFSYYTGIGFAIFSENLKRELCFGGQYSINHFSKKVDGMGLSILFDGLLKTTKIKNKNKKVFVPKNHIQNIPSLLRNKGWTTILSYKKSKTDVADAKKFGCSYILSGKILEKIKY